MGGAAAVSYAHYGACRAAALTKLIRGIEDWELPIPRTLVAPLIRGARNGVADALSRFILRARGRDPYPDRQPRGGRRKMVKEERGRMGVDSMASDSGDNPSSKAFRSPPHSAFEAAPPGGRRRRRPPQDFVCLVIDRLFSGRRARWGSAALCLRPEYAGGWSSRLLVFLGGDVHP